MREMQVFMFATAAEDTSSCTSATEARRRLASELNRKIWFSISRIGVANLHASLSHGS